jgi:uncharacterized protein (TIGR04551 family)
VTAARSAITAAVAVVAAVALPRAAAAWDWTPRISVDGYLRTRGDIFYNFDLSRGPTPSTLSPIWPTAAATDVAYQTGMDMRLRLEPTFHVGSVGAVHLRLDVLDNVVLGSMPVGGGPYDGLALGQGWPSDAFRVTRAWGEILLPFGAIAIGRMGPLVDWGTGIWVNAGDGLDDDFGDSGDRVVFTTSLARHIFLVAYELTASGAVHAPALWGETAFDREPDDDARSLAFAFARYNAPRDLARRIDAGRTTINYGLVLALRFQDWELADPPEGLAPRPEDAIRRDLRVVAADAWFRLNWRRLRLEVEAVYAHGELLATTTPGVELTTPVTSDQWGSVLQAAWEPPRGLGADLEIGVASGDDAPGFGVRLRPDQAATVDGDLDGPQLRYPDDTTIDNFRFHPNHRVDLILWRRIVGAVTDALYGRVRVWYVWRTIRIETALVLSSALHEETTPGDGRLLGLEWDTAATWAIDRGVAVSVAYGLLVPFSGLGSPALGLDAEVAHAGHAVVSWSF